jgi:hypothetical protein
MHKIYLPNSNEISHLKLRLNAGFMGDHIHLDMIFSILFPY